MAVFYSASHRGFFDTRFQTPPPDAVKLTARRHSDLLAGQEQGASIEPGPNGRPVLSWPDNSVSVQRARLVQSIKCEARRRIEFVSPLWRQINDLRNPSPDGAARFAHIDLIRARSDEIEAAAAALPAESIASFDVAQNPAWPFKEPA